MTISSFSSRSSRGWTDERRAKHAASIRQWAPWKSSTGPRTAQGKSISSLNALKHGAYSRPAMAFYRHLRDFLTLCRDTREKFSHFHRNELLKKRKLKRLKGTFKRIFRRLTVQQAAIYDPNYTMTRNDIWFR